jgi:tetratricopeptide (TPR) repeat protein
MLLFTLNPLLSMPMDWDLFSIPAPLLLVLVALLASQVESNPGKVGAPVVALILLSVPVFAVNMSVNAHSYRLESIAKRSFKTYYLRSSSNLIDALGFIKDDVDLYLERKQNLIEDLQPYALEGNDPMYSHLLMDDGFYFLRVGNDPVKARQRLTLACAYDPGRGDTRMFLMETNFVLRDFKSAFKDAEKLVQINFPDGPTAHKMAIHCALEAELYDEALDYAKKYLGQFPEDDVVREVKDRIENQQERKELRKLVSDN